jgi:hypothetical protein
MRVAPAVDGATPVVCGHTARVLESTTHAARERDRHAAITRPVVCRRVTGKTPSNRARHDDTNDNAGRYQRRTAFARGERVPRWRLTGVDRRRLLRPAKSIRSQYLETAEPTIAGDIEGE